MQFCKANSDKKISRVLQENQISSDTIYFYFLSKTKDIQISGVIISDEP
jgi:hypothetical protein